MADLAGPAVTWDTSSNSLRQIEPSSESTCSGSIYSNSKTGRRLVDRLGRRSPGASTPRSGPAKSCWQASARFWPRRRSTAFLPHREIPCSRLKTGYGAVPEGWLCARTKANRLADYRPKNVPRISQGPVHNSLGGFNARDVAVARFALRRTPTGKELSGYPGDSHSYSL
jgi:hypothetical protein